MVINFENVLHKYVVQTANSLRMTRSEMTGYSFLVIQKSQTLF